MFDVVVAIRTLDRERRTDGCLGISFNFINEGTPDRNGEVSIGNLLGIKLLVLNDAI